MTRARGLTSALRSGAAAVIALALSAPASDAQDASITVTRAGAGTVTIEPGARASAAFTIANHAAGEVRVRIEVASPPGWGLLQPRPEIALDAHARALQLVSFSTPDDSRPGLYAIRLTARGELEPPRSDSVLVEVLEQGRLQASVESSPRWASAGDRYNVVFRVRNAGNVPLPVEFTLTSGAGVEATVGTAGRALAPGETMPVVASVQVPAHLDRNVSHSLRLDAASPAPEAKAEAIARVDLIPSGAGGDGPRAVIPGEIRARLGSDARAGAPLRVELRGPLAPGSDTRIALTMNGPGESHSIFGETDEYRLRLESSRYLLRLGDDVYRLSSLTEPGRMGTGGEARLRAGWLEVGGYAQRNRRSAAPSGGPQAGAFVQIGMGALGRARVNWLRSQGPSDAREVWSTEGTLRMGDWGRLTGEYGFRPENRAAGRTARLALGPGPLSVDLRHMQTDSAYGGTYAGVRADGASVSLRPWRSLYLQASVDADSEEGTNGTGPFRIGTGARRMGLGYGSWIGAEAAERTRSTDFGVDGTWATSRSLRLRSGLTLGGFSLHPGAELGVITSSSTAAGRFLRASVRTGLTWDWARLSGSIEYSDGPTLHGTQDDGRVSAALGTRVDVGRNTRLDLTLRASGDRSGSGIPSLYASGRIEQNLPGGHRISLQAVSRSWAGLGFASVGEPLFLMDYSIPFSMPGIGGDRGGSGSATVRVFDSVTGDPVSRALVRVGNRTRSTDTGGRATFERLPAGTHVVALDRATAGVERVPLINLPQALEVRPGSRPEIDVALAHAARLSARVQISRAPSAAAASRGAQGLPEPMPGALLEFSRAGEVIRRETGADGIVRLSDLRPGFWSVRVTSAALPPFHRFAEESISLEIAPGASEAVEFLATGQARRMTIVSSAELTDDAALLRVYLVAAVDLNLRDVAARVYRNAALWPKVWLANCGGIPDPDVIRSGQILTVPPGDTLTAEERAAIGVTGVRPERCSREEPARGYRLARTDFTLRDVARIVYEDAALWPKIWYANRETVPDPDRIRGGLILTIPPKGAVTAAEREALEEYRRGNPG